MMQDKIIEKLHGLGISELTKVTSLNELKGDYINVECKLPNGLKGKILDDNKIYYGNQIEKENSDRCYGVAGDNDQLAVFEYGCNATDAELIAWVKL